jgi:predicted permease
LWVTFGAVLLLLAIACLNVANLMLARLAERHKELIVRAALGSGRVRLVRQVLAEGLLLALAGAALGALAADAAVLWFRHVSPFNLPPHAGEVRVDLAVLTFAAGLAIATALVFAVVPALQASRIDLTQGLKAAGRGYFGAASRRRTAQTLVAVEVAVSFVLLIGSGLLLTSVLNLGAGHLGFHTEGIISVEVELKPEQSDRFQRALIENLQALPAVDIVLRGWVPPWEPNDNIVEDRIEVEGQNPVSDSPALYVQGGEASPRYFEMLGTKLLAGRFFDEHDAGAPVALVSETLVAEHFAGQNPLGQKVRILASEEKPTPWLTIVGVVEDWKHLVRDAEWRNTPMVFRPVGAAGPRMAFALKAFGNPAPLIKQIQQQISSLEPNAEVTVPPALLRDRLAQNLDYPEFRAELLAGFAFGALILAAVGLHGVLAQLVTQRTPEFGVRRAVGAQTRDVLWLVARQGGGPVFAGLVAGLIAALLLTRVIQSMLYGVQPTDPGVLALTASVLLLAAVVAMALPARRAVRVDPIAALREE